VAVERLLKTLERRGGVAAGEREEPPAALERGAK
jgi:hypothetical protein